MNEQPMKVCTHNGDVTIVAEYADGTRVSLAEIEHSIVRGVSEVIAGTVDVVLADVDEVLTDLELGRRFPSLDATPELLVPALLEDCQAAQAALSGVKLVLVDRVERLSKLAQRIGHVVAAKGQP
ncbi:MAG TPA: hypothetical protein VG963_09140 [Polyangiaceae bacterium]|nr:hypothetical protein [Polyangiaceae bacterium]